MKTLEKSIEIEGRQVKVVFANLFHPGQDKFVVVVISENSVSLFEMEQGANKLWRICTRVPDWILCAELRFSVALEMEYMAYRS